jgi:hypothetical protein
MIVQEAASMTRCANDSCEKPITRPNRYRFCSRPCDLDQRRRDIVRRWLETGEGQPHSHDRSAIRAYILAEQSGRCAICSIAGEWNGAVLKFILDHIDGNSEHNKRDNLRLVYPNCDSQLPTYKIRNRGNGRHKRRERYAAGLSY